MAITIEDILQLEVFKEATLLTNRETKEQTIRSVSVVDAPLYSGMIEEKILLPGDFFFSTLNIYRDDTMGLLNAINILIESKSSGLCVTNEHIKEIPDVIINLCNDNKFPLIQVDKDIPYSLMIREIIEAILSNQSYVLKINTINSLLTNNVMGEEKIKLIQRLNPHFKNHYKVFYLTNFTTKHSSSFVEMINLHKSWFAVPYSEGILAILTFSETDQDKTDKQFKELTDFMVHESKVLGEPVVGISSRHDSIMTLQEGIREALFAVKSAPYTREHILYYDQLGSIRLLIALKDHRELMNYYQLTIQKIIDYDSQYNLALFDTLQTFVQHNGDYKMTAKASNQHENTVRYRINKIKGLLDLEERQLQFYETISLGIKIYNLLNA